MTVQPIARWRIHGHLTTPTPGARESMRRANGLAVMAPRHSPVPSRTTAVVPPQKGHGTPVVARSTQNVGGRRMWIAASTTARVASRSERRTTTRSCVLLDAATPECAVQTPTAPLLEIVTQLL